MSKEKGCWEKAQNRVYPAAILVSGIIMYYGIIFLHFLTRSDLKGWEVFFLILEHFLIFMTVWSYLTTYFTDPGRPPVFWVR
jgi:hypothetical protein